MRKTKIYNNVFCCTYKTPSEVKARLTQLCSNQLISKLARIAW